MTRYLISFLLILMLSTNVSGQTYKDLIRQADSLYKAKNYEGSNALYQHAFKLEGKNPYDLYNGACSAALSGDRDQAFKMLNLSLKYALVDINHLKTDSDLDNLHADNDWDKLIKRVQKTIDSIESNYDKPLKVELEVIYRDDQNTRAKYVAAGRKLGYEDRSVDSLNKIINVKDSINLIKVTRILDTRGWLGKDKVGEMGNTALFLVIQHGNLKTQLKYFTMMREAVNNGNLSPVFFAKFEDRISLRQGKRQIYGTHVIRNKESDKFYVAPLDDPDNVDKRRATVGLPPIAESVKYWSILWNVEEYKKELPEIEKLNKLLSEKE